MTGTWLTVVGVLSSIGGLLGATGGIALLLRIRADKKKLVAEAGHTEAEARKILVSTSLTLVEPLERRVKELTQEANVLREEMQRRVRELTDEADMLRRELNDARRQVCALTETLEEQRSVARVEINSLNAEIRRLRREREDDDTSSDPSAR